MSKYVDNTKAELRNQSKDAVQVAQNAVASRAWLYPVKGIVYFVSHRSCWGPFLKALPPALLLSAGVLAFMFGFTYLPQAAFLSIINFGPWGFISAIPLVLSESYIVFQTLSKAFILDDLTTEVFDKVLVDRQLTSLVENGRVVSGKGATSKMGKALMSPLARFSPKAVAYYILTLPLNFVPVVGTVVFFLLNGAKTGPSLHARYFQLKKFSEDQKKAHIKKQRGQYAAMGTAALLLQIIPVANVLFAFSNAAGAALYAADLEKGTNSLDEDVKNHKTDLLVRQRFQNPLPAPAFPPKLLTIKTDPARYASYDFLVPLSLEREVPMIVDSEGGMHLDQNLVPGYWESTKQGRDGAMAPDLNAEVELDDEDLELLVDPPALGAAANSSAAGIMPPNGGGANLDIIGSGRPGAANGRSPASILDQRRKDSIWIRRSEYSIQSDANNALKKEAMVREMAAQKAAKQVEQTPEERLASIINTFSAVEVPLSEVKHPTKPHLQAVESFDILPDEDLWANQYALFKFADNPNDRRAGQSSQPVASSSASTVGLIRPLETEGDESGSNRVAYFIPDDEDTANTYLTKRRSGKNADEQLLAGATEETEEDIDTYGFRFMRDYDAIRRDTNKEYIFVIEEGEGESSDVKDNQGEEASSDDQHLDKRAKGAYYVPLVSHTLLRKRRARKGEVTNDYDDLGIEFWGGILVSLGGQEVFPEDEAEARKSELYSIRMPLSSLNDEDEGTALKDGAEQTGQTNGQ